MRIEVKTLTESLTERCVNEARRISVYSDVGLPEFNRCNNCINQIVAQVSKTYPPSVLFPELQT